MIKGTEHILIIKLSSIGDVVHSLPLVEVLKSNCPELKIDWCVERESVSILEENPAINKVIIYDKNEWKKGALSPLRWPKITKDVYFFVKELLKWQYDLVIDLQGLLKSGIIAGICRAERKIGLDGAREFGWLFVEERVPVSYDQHAIDRYIEVAKYLGCSSLDWHWKTYISEEERQGVDDLIYRVNKDGLPIVAINPCARWKTKMWPAERFSELAKRLIHHGVMPIFLGGAQDRILIDRILDGLDGAINLAGLLSLKQLTHLYSRSDVVVTVDTGPMHIAVMAGAKVVAIFGPTDPRRTGPYGAGHDIIRLNLPCSPCFKRECDKMDCIKGVGVDKVMDSIIKKLDQEKG